MPTKSYRTEEGKDVNLSRLLNPSNSVSAAAHQGLVLARHDVIIDYQGAKLLLRQSSSPGKGLYLPVGGEIQRGVEIEESLQGCVQKVCNLRLEDITELGTTRTLWKDDPFGHGHGTDAVTWMYSAKGRGDLVTSNPDQVRLVRPQYYASTRDTFDLYVRDCLDAVFFERRDDFRKGYIEAGMDVQQMQADPLPREEYAKAHQSMVIPCQDVFIFYEGGILLINRDNLPAKDVLWPLGGRVQRGLTMEESLQKRVKAECNLDIERIEKIGTARTFFATDPIGHGHGTDSMNHVYVTVGKGTLRLDDLHKDPFIVTPAKYTEGFREQLHPYVRDFVDQIMPQLR